MTALLPECLHWPFCPGFFIAILAFLAATVTFRKDPRPRERAAWIFSFLILMVGEVWMMSKDHHAHEVADKNIRDTEQDHFSTLLQMSRDTEAIIQGFIHTQELVAQTESARAQHHKIADKLLDLKARTAKLSSDVFRLLFMRSMGSPPYPRPSTWEEDIARLGPYDRQTILLYEQDYGTRVRQISEELKQNGLEDKTLETFVVPTPVNILTITEIAKHLAAQAERITADGVKPLPMLL